MVNSIQQLIPQDALEPRGKPSMNSRRPLQPRSVNSSTSPVPAKSSKTSKPKMNPLASRSKPQHKTSIFSENITSFPTFDTVTTSLSSESERSEPLETSIFRRRADLPQDDDEDSNDMFALKRANPVYESDDEEYLMFSSPTKRQRKSESLVLHADEQVFFGEENRFSGLPGL